MASYAQTVLADNPNVYLRFEETAGASCADSTANGRTGTAHGTFGRNVAMGLAGLDIGISITLGTGNNVTIANNALLEAVKPVTLEIWWKVLGQPTLGSIMSQGATSSPAADGWNVNVSNLGQVSVVRASAGTLAVQTGTGAVVGGTLYHVVFTKDSSDNNTIYLNGAQAATANNATLATASGEPFCIGGNSLGGTIFNALDGTFDEFAIYPTALSAARVAAHYAARNTAASSSPTIAKSPPPSVVARVRKPHPVGGPKGQPPPVPSPLPGFGHLDGERRKREDQ